MNFILFLTIPFFFFYFDASTSILIEISIVSSSLHSAYLVFIKINIRILLKMNLNEINCGFVFSMICFNNIILLQLETHNFILYGSMK